MPKSVDFGPVGKAIHENSGRKAAIFIWLTQGAGRG